MLYLPDRLTLWLAWIALASAFFTVVPLGPYGLLGWFGAVGPLLHRMVPSIGAKRIALIGLGSIALIGIAAGDTAWLEPALAAAVFLFGLLLAPVPITGYQDPLQQGAADNTEAAMQLALAREVGRARRHHRPLTLISASCELEDELPALEAAFASELHIYAQIFSVDGQLKIIVPELDDLAYKSLERRVLKAAEASNLHSITLGVACFPDGECTASGMLDIAEKDLKLFRLGRNNGSADPSDRDGVDSGLPVP